MTELNAEERLKLIEAKYIGSGLNPYDYMPVVLPQGFLMGTDDEATLKIAKFLEKIWEARVADEEKNKKEN
jgi:hypothetical protein